MQQLTRLYVIKFHKIKTKGRKSHLYKAYLLTSI